MTYKLGQIGHGTVVIENAFSDDEPTGKGTFPLPPLLVDALKNVGQALHDIVVIPPDRASRNLEALLDSEVHTAVRNDHIPTLAERRNDGADGRERLRVQDGRLSPKEICNILFELEMHVCKYCGISIQYLCAD